VMPGMPEAQSAKILVQTDWKASRVRGLTMAVAYQAGSDSKA
jgi:hypothetical protein